MLGWMVFLGFNWFFWTKTLELIDRHNDYVMFKTLHGYK